MRYAVLGGTPQYQVWAGADSLREILVDSVLAVDEALYEEPLPNLTKVLGRLEDLGHVELRSPWWSRDGRMEIDIAGVSDRRFVQLGSCKWHQQARASVLGQLLDHREPLGPVADGAHLVIFARGFDDALVSKARTHGVTLVSADDLFAGS